jgi:hypothetical protein
MAMASSTWGGRDPEDFKAATRVLGALKRFIEAYDGVDLDTVIRGAWEREALGPQLSRGRQIVTVLERGAGDMGREAGLMARSAPRVSSTEEGESSARG